jgi:glycosyltransferase involved in cell wall biosynthesis
MDCDPALPDLRSLRERMLYRYGLKHADRVIVQTRRQQEMLQRWFNREGTIIPMPCVDQAGGSEPRRLPPADRQRILWIGRLCRPKRPDRLLELARACPDLQFDFAGPTGNDEYSQDMFRRAQQIPNLKVHGKVPRDRVHECYRQAACLCCTSEFEGFPNTFLEAWSHGLPIVSTFDPDNLIATRGLGHVASDVSGLATGLRRLLNSPAEWQAASIRARQYYSENHPVESVLPRFEQLFREVAGRAAALARGTA